MKPALAAAIALAVVLQRPASAAEPGGEILEQAKAHFEQALAFHDQGLHREAIAEYQAAYDLVPEPELIFNIGLEQEAADDPVAALASYRRYLELAPDGKVAGEARENVARLTRPAARRRATQHGRQLRIAGLVTGGVGLVSVAVGIKYGLEARDLTDEIEHHEGRWDQASLRLQDDFASARNKAYLLSGIGAACIVGGLVLYVVGGSDEVQVVPTAGPDRAGLVLRGTF